MICTPLRDHLLFAALLAASLTSGCADDPATAPSSTADMAADMITTDMSSPPADMPPRDMAPPDMPPDMASPKALKVLGGRCDASALREQDARAADTLPATFTLGEFAAEVDTAGRLRVTPADDPTRALFATPADAPPVRGAHVNLEIEESQGSFLINEEEDALCRKVELTRAAHRGEVLVLQGRFFDAHPKCKNVQFEVQLCPAGPAGHLGFSVRTATPEGGPSEVNVLELNVASSAEERVYGMGEQFPHNTLNLKGRLIPALVQEGGIGRGHEPISTAVNAFSRGSAGGEETTYYAAPHYLTSDNRSVFLEDTAYSTFDFRADAQTTIRLYDGAMNGRILRGDSPLQLIERFTEYAGRQPPLPDWVHDGAIVALARPLDESTQHVNALKAAGAHIAGVWNQTWSGVSETFVGEQVLWNWIQNPNAHPGWMAFVEQMNAQDVHVLCYVNSMFRPLPDDAGMLRRHLFAEGDAAGYFVKHPDGSTYLMPVTAFDVGLLDLTNPAARAWMKDILKEELVKNAGCSGWMADFAEALPFDAALASGEDPAHHHNQYPVAWMQLNREALEEANLLGEVLIFNRSGFTTTPRHSLLLWEGDQLTTWDKYDGMVSALRGLISGGLSGIALNHSDTGGYTALTRFNLGYRREAEQLKRWTEMNAFTAVLRTHEGNAPADNAQVYDDDEARAHFARFTKVYRALKFYRKQLEQDATQRGWPMVRHLLLHYPDDPKAHEVDDQFLLGAELLVAPIKNKCFTPPLCPYDKQVYLPRGEWVHLWSGEVYGDTTKGVEVSVKAPIGQPAVFYKKGSPVGAQLVMNLAAAGIEVTAPTP